MLRRLVDFSLENRPLVLIAAVLVVVGGGYALTQLPIDAVPDITNVQVQVLTKAPALGPVEMEQFVTYPIEAAMNGLPRLVEIRSISRYGLSAVTVVFEDGVDVYFARQLVAERLVQAREAIPEGLGNPEMGPVTTGLGDVFQFTVEGEGVSAMERRTILDWMIAPRLRAVPGVTEVNAWGGLPKQYQVVVDPAKLRAHGLSLKEVFEAVERGSMNAGGGYIEHNREQYIVRGEGLVGSLADIEKIVLKAEGGGNADHRGQRGPGARGGDAAHRRRHRRRPRRDRDRPRPDAGGRERPRGGDAGPPGRRGAAADAAEGRPDRAVLRPRGLRAPGDPHGRDEPARGQRARDRGAVRLPRQRAGRPHRGLRHPAVDAAGLHRHGRVRASRPT